MLDCKLTDSKAEGPVGTQLRAAATTKFHLGDGATHMILLRPNWLLPPGFDDLVEALHLTVIDRTALTRENLPTAVARLLSTPVQP